MNINGIPVNRIVDSLLTVSPSDGLHGLARKLDNISILPLDADTSNYNLSDIYFPLFFPRNFNTPLYRLALQHYRSNQTYTATVGALSKKERLIAYKSRFGILPVHEQNWNLRLLKNSTAILRIGDFETWEWKADYKKYLDSIFTLLKERGVKKLVVDIRGNGGGDDEARDKVFSYLTDKPFGCTDPMHRRIRFLTIPDTQLPYLKTWNRSFKEPKKPADYVKYADGLYENKADLQAACQPIQPKAKHFTGQKFLLLDSRNASTTFTMAKLFRNEHIGPLVGEPTSGNQQGINGGQFFFLNLPYSKIEADIPLSWGAYLAKAPDTGIKPDKFIAVTRKSIASGHDTQLDEVIKMAGN